MSFELSSEVDGNQVFLVPSSEIDTRLDPFYYRTEFQLLEKRLHNSPYRVEKLIRLLKKLVNGYDCRDYAEQGIPYLKVANVKPNKIVLEGVSYIPDLPIDKDSTVRQGDFLLTRKGSFGIAAVVGDEVDRAIISSEVFKLTLRDTLDERYLAYWFNTAIGQLYFDRIKTGAIMGHISQEALKSVLVPVPPLEIQNRIVGKMDATYTVKKQKEAQAQQLLDSVDDYLLTELGIEKPEEQDNTQQNRIFYQQLSKVSEARFDPEYFRQSYEYMNTAISKSKHPLKKLKDVCAALLSGKTPSSLSYSEEKTDFPIVKVSTYSGQEIDLSKVSYTLENQALTVKKGDTFILSAAHQSSYVGRFIKYLDEAPEIPTSYVGELICVRPSSSVCNTLFVFSLLSTELYKNLLNREKRGQTSHIYPKDIGQIKIPLPPLGKQDEIANHIALVRQKAKQLQQEAGEGLEQAKREVEVMILGEATVEL